MSQMSEFDVKSGIFVLTFFCDAFHNFFNFCDKHTVLFQLALHYFLYQVFRVSLLTCRTKNKKNEILQTKL